MKDADATGGSFVEMVVGVISANERCAGGRSGAGNEEEEEEV